MGIVRTEKKNGITICYVKLQTKEDYYHGKTLKSYNVKTIIDYDVDVYSEEDGKLLLRFRKNKLPIKSVEAFYDNVIDFASKVVTTNRGIASGTLINEKRYGNPVHSNIMGYFDKFSPLQKIQIRNYRLKYMVRECRFNRDHPDKFKKMIPYIQSIDMFYKKLMPDHYIKQRKKANQTCFKIPNTAFTTITTNVNYQTAVHQDKGDDDEGFGNLCVIEHGTYTGGETCFPQYGIGVDVRSGDVLFMDVHKFHGNLPIIKKTEDAVRLSVVCYLRTNVWKNSMHSTKKQCDKQNKTIRKIATDAIKRADLKRFNNKTKKIILK